MAYCCESSQKWRKLSLGITALLVIAVNLYFSTTLWASNRYLKQKNVAISDSIVVERNRTTKPILDSGWDQVAKDLYINTRQALEARRLISVTIPPREQFLVSHQSWWLSAFPKNGKITWEPETFEIFDSYITSETVVVDFGTWIGPTILYNAQVAKHVYGIEADPSAFAEVEKNVQLNRVQDWSKHVTLESACVSAPHHVGNMTMKSTRAGDSMSGIGKKIFMQVKLQWQVQCYTLQDIFDKWGLSLSREEVFIKMDIESYECELLPSLFDWLVNEPVLPTIYVSFHNQIATCSDEQWSRALKVMKLYQSITMDGKPLAIENETTLLQLIPVVAYGPSFVLSNKDVKNHTSIPQ